MPENPVPFLTSGENGRFEVHEEAKKLLGAIEGPLAVVAVAGLWRTGKSFLLNSLLGLNGQPESFVVGNTINACTKGIWVVSSRLCVTPLITPPLLSVEKRSVFSSNFSVESTLI